MTFADLRLRLAERVGLVQQDSAQRVIARTTEPDRTRLNNAINDGVREFMGFAGPVLSNGRPIPFQGWEWAVGQFSIGIAKEPGAYSVGGDPSVLGLPPMMSTRPAGAVTYKRLDASTDGGEVALAHPTEITTRHAQDSNTVGAPCMASVAFNPAARSSLGTRGGWEMRVWPKPDTDYTISFSARVQPVAFTQDDERGIWPEIHDLTIVACAAYMMMLADKPAGDAAVRQARDEMDRRLQISANRDIHDYRNITGNRLFVEQAVGKPYRITDVDGNLLKAGVTYPRGYPS